MKLFKRSLTILLILSMFLLPAAVLGEEAPTATPDADVVETQDPADEATPEETAAPEEDAGVADGTEGEGDASGDTAGDATEAEVTFFYSDNIDENGYWEGVTALDHVELFDYEGIAIPSESHTITDEAVQEQIASILATFSTSEHVHDRAVADGDTVNIDYVGSVDGVEFEGGSTSGAGTDVTIGVTSYIEGFLDQLIGHTPGDTFDLNVTFPEDYQEESLQGKDAVFVTTVNYILAATNPELTDAFVQENLEESYGWTSVEQMESDIRADMEKNAVQSFLQEFVIANMNVSNIPDELLVYQENALLSYYAEYAGYFGMGLEDFVTSYLGIESVEALIEENHAYSVEGAEYYLTIQAISEDTGIAVTDQDVADFFEHYYDTPDYAEYEAMYGMPYLKQAVLNQMILDYLEENAVLE